MRQPPSKLRNSKLICKVVLIGTYSAIVVIALLLWINVSLNPQAQALLSLIVCGIALLYIAVVHLLAQFNRYVAMAYLLVLFYVLLATGIVWVWGINTPIGLLIFGLVIVLAGIVLTGKHSLFAAIASGSILISIQTVSTLHWHTPDISWTNTIPSYGDALAYCVVFSMLALISWLYNREIEQSFAQAKQAEEALLQQKATLKLQVKQRTAELRQAQLKEMQQMYRFAELGQLGVTLLHDLANHLTALTLEIEDLKSKAHSKAVTRAQEIIRYLEGVVHSTRERLHGGTQTQTFTLARKIDEVVAFLQAKAAKAQVTIIWEAPATIWKYQGDPDSLSQVIAIIMNNAIDAYGPEPTAPRSARKARQVIITLQRNDKQIIIKIGDWGKGIAKNQRKYLFRPFHGTKRAGLGIGLFIAKQTIETQFGGAIILNARSDHTEFIIRLPLTHEK